jgi:hypothetical protein
MTFSAQLRDAALDLAWSLWSELGVSTWARTHEDWAVEVEPLVAFTALVGSHDRRLLRESVDWCIAYDDLVSLHQLRGVIAHQGWPLEGAIADFSATVSQGTRRSWPGAKEGEPLDVSPAGGRVFGPHEAARPSNCACGRCSASAPARRSSGRC